MPLASPGYQPSPIFAIYKGGYGVTAVTPFFEWWDEQKRGSIVL